MSGASFLGELVGVVAVGLIAAALALVRQIAETYLAGRAKAGEGR